jgi:hypothetical protein
LKYKLRYIDKLPDTRSAAANRGLDKHKSIEQFLKKEIDTLPIELNFYTQFLTGLRSYENYPEHKVALTVDWEPCAWDSEIAWYRGVYDLKLLQTPEEATVYDWKTGKIYEDHNDQKSLYSVAVFAEQPALRSVRAIHVYLDLNQSREKLFHAGEVRQLREQWASRAKKLEEDKEFIPNPGFHCRWCSYSKAKGGPCRF